MPENNFGCFSTGAMDLRWFEMVSNSTGINIQYVVKGRVHTKSDHSVIIYLPFTCSIPDYLLLNTNDHSLKKGTHFLVLVNVGK